MVWKQSQVCVCEKGRCRGKETLPGKGEISLYTASPQVTAPDTAWDGRGLLVSDAPREDSTANNTDNIALSLQRGVSYDVSDSSRDALGIA